MAAPLFYTYTTDKSIIWYICGNDCIMLCLVVFYTCIFLQTGQNTGIQGYVNAKLTRIQGYAQGRFTGIKGNANVRHI